VWNLVRNYPKSPSVMSVSRSNNEPSEQERLEEELISFLSVNMLHDEVSLTAETSLRNIGLDSFSLMEVVLFLEKRHGKRFPLELLTEEHTSSVRSLVRSYLGTFDDELSCSSR
jgi:acyl carrier protein